MRPIGVLLALIAIAAPVTAGELFLTNGSRLEADLTGETILVSTGADVIEVSPETIGLLTPSEIRLKDGRVLRGTVVGGRLRTRTPLGELAIRIEELQGFRTQGFADLAAPKPVPAAPAPPTATSAPAPRDVVPPAAATPPGGPAVATVPQPAATPPLRVASTTGPTAVLARPVPGPTLEVISDESLLRDALTNASTIGRVARGQTVTKVDVVDRRLRIFNRLIFDGGHWIKVRVGDGTEGWVPAASVREVR
jgi:hypothetical protein